ncbi:hypothetical protein [Microseira wollei]|uniref:Uncharacterized protein n=1 Tax=Microseira wollei NIES-4236 TaxID=2530354 RepID=A0AAV3XAN0_9CYAN|nr:hypothetical protein [Microseira wollei]GET38451.1 hypothetical protein MiSe_32090 [Microseira wollei NIES-4236]
MNLETRFLAETGFLSSSTWRERSRYYKCIPLIMIYMAGRKKLDRTSLHARVAPNTPDKLKEIAFKLGYIYDEQGSTGQLLDAIAEGKIILVQSAKSG